MSLIPLLDQPGYSRFDANVNWVSPAWVKLGRRSTWVVTTDERYRVAAYYLPGALMAIPREGFTRRSPVPFYSLSSTGTEVS